MYKHRIAKGEETIFLIHRDFVSVHHVFLSCESTDKHNQSAFGKVEIGDKCVNRLEFIARIDENSRFSVHRMNSSIGS